MKEGNNTDRYPLELNQINCKEITVLGCFVQKHLRSSKWRKGKEIGSQAIWESKVKVI